jgi:hypothetical protein
MHIYSGPCIENLKLNNVTLISYAVQIGKCSGFKRFLMTKPQRSVAGNAQLQDPVETQIRLEVADGFRISDANQVQTAVYDLETYFMLLCAGRPCKCNEEQYLSLRASER